MEGGGLYDTPYGGRTLTLINGTVPGNTADVDGGIHNAGTFLGKWFHRPLVHPSQAHWACRGADPKG